MLADPQLALDPDMVRDLETLLPEATRIAVANPADPELARPGILRFNAITRNMLNSLGSNNHTNPALEAMNVDEGWLIRTRRVLRMVLRSHPDESNTQKMVIATSALKALKNANLLDLRLLGIAKINTYEVRRKGGFQDKTEELKQPGEVHLHTNGKKNYRYIAPSLFMRTLWWYIHSAQLEHVVPEPAEKSHFGDEVKSQLELKVKVHVRRCKNSIASVNRWGRDQVSLLRSIIDNGGPLSLEEKAELLRLRAENKALRDDADRLKREHRMELRQRDRQIDRLRRGDTDCEDQVRGEMGKVVLGLLKRSYQSIINSVRREMATGGSGGSGGSGSGDKRARV